jgi:hypothetical protein
MRFAVDYWRIFRVVEVLIIYPKSFQNNPDWKYHDTAMSAKDNIDNCGKRQNR